MLLPKIEYKNSLKRLKLMNNTWNIFKNGTIRMRFVKRPSWSTTVGLVQRIVVRVIKRALKHFNKLLIWRPFKFHCLSPMWSYLLTFCKTIMQKKWLKIILYTKLLIWRIHGSGSIRHENNTLWGISTIIWDQQTPAKQDTLWRFWSEQRPAATYPH